MKFLDLSEKQGRKEFRAVQRIKSVRHPNLVMTYAMWLLDDAMKVIEDAEFEAMRAENSDPLRGTLIQSPIEDPSVRTPRMLVIATALCDQNLMERLQECQSQALQGIPHDELIGYMSDAAKAIDFLNAPRHDLTRSDRPTTSEKKVLSAIHHCDIKPANIMLVGDSAVVGDFGVARVLGTLSSTTRATKLGGSVAYAPPEIFENRSEATSDQYSLAITYYELLTGKLPFDEHSVAQVMRDKSQGKLVFANVSSSTRKILTKATSVKPDQRFSSASEFVDRLAAASGQGARGGRSRAVLKTSNSWRLAKGLITVLLLSIASLFGWQYQKEIETGIRTIAQRIKLPSLDSKPGPSIGSAIQPEPIEETTSAAVLETPFQQQPIDSASGSTKSRDLTRSENPTESTVGVTPEPTLMVRPASPEKSMEARVEFPTPLDSDNSQYKNPTVDPPVELSNEPTKAVMEQPTRPELPEVTLAKQAFEIVDQAIVTESSRNEAVQLLSKALSLGYKIEPIHPMGTDRSNIPNNLTFSISIPCFDPNGTGFLKAIGKNLIYRSFDPTVITPTIEVENVTKPIVRVDWDRGSILLLDQSNRVWMIASSTNPLNPADWADETSFKAEQLVPDNEATWASNEITAPTFFLVRKSASNVTNSTTDSDSFASLYQRVEDGQLQSCNGMESLAMRSWPPLMETNKSQNMIFISDRTNTSRSAFHLFNASTGTTFPLALSALNPLTSVEQAVFIQDGTSLLLRGRHAKESFDHVYWLRFQNLSTPDARELQSEYGAPQLLISDDATGFISLFDQACTQTIRADNQWVERDIATTIKSLYASSENNQFSAASVQSMVVAPNRWLVMATNRSSLILAKLFDEERVEDHYRSQPFVCLELPWQSDNSTIDHLHVAGSYLISTSKTNVSAWYNLNRITTIVEACLLLK